MGYGDSVVVRERESKRGERLRSLGDSANPPRTGPVCRQLFQAARTVLTLGNLISGPFPAREETGDSKDRDGPWGLAPGKWEAGVGRR